MNKICVYAICKNEIKYIKQWLNMVSCADYVVVIDTGSTDGTWEILNNYENIITEQKIFSPFRFDEARNYAMSKCPIDANILVCLDIDESISNGWDDIIRINWFSGVHKLGIIQYKLITKNSVETYYKEKIHTRDLCWVHPVHESLANSIDYNSTATINISTEQIINFSEIIISHDRNENNSDRYENLLRIGANEFPNCARCECMLGRDLLSRGKISEAKESFEKTINKIDLSETKEYIVYAYNSLASILLFENPNLSLYYASCAMCINNTIIEPYLLMAESYRNMNNYNISESILTFADNYCNYNGSWVESRFSWDVKRYFLHAVNNYYLNNFEIANEFIDSAINNYNGSSTDLCIVKQEIEKNIKNSLI